MILTGKREDTVIGAVALGIAAMCAMPATSMYRDASALMFVQRIPAVTSLAATSTKARPALTARQMVTELRDGGMPISAIAEASRVERKTIYSWLQGAAVRGDKTQRLEAVHALVTGVEGVAVRDVYRFWHSKIDGERTLRDLLVSDDVGSAAARGAVLGLRSAALKAIETERKMTRPSKAGNALDEIPEAVPLR